jgi:hypothetical protein
MKLKAVPEINTCENKCEGCVFRHLSRCVEDQIIDGELFYCMDDNIIYVEDKETKEIKQLTLEELRKQFEKEYKKIGEYTDLEFSVDSKGKYEWSYMHIRWCSYLQCAKANGIIKE